MLISNALFDLTRYDTPKRGIETYILVFKLCYNLTSQHKARG